MFVTLLTVDSQSVKGKNDTFKSCLIKLPKTTTSVVPSSEQPVVPSSPASSPNTISKVPKASATLPATATRCLSLVRYLTLVQEQQLAQQAQGQAQGHQLSSQVGETAQDRPVAFPSHQAPPLAQVQVAEVRSSSGALAGGAAASVGGTLHVMSALERRLASLTVQDASSLVAASATATISAEVPTLLTLRNKDSQTDSPAYTDSNNSTSSSPVVISPNDLQSSSRVADEEREGFSEHVLLSPTSTQRAPPPASSLSTASEDYVVV